ncbi:MAG TPA: P-loop NTPase [Gemmatimonadales bacterium]
MSATEAPLNVEPSSASVRVPLPDSIEGSRPVTLVVGSGKGGVGKSLVSILLAECMAADGRRVLLCDADQNLPNLHLLLGMKPVVQTEALLYGGISPESLLRLAGTNLWLLPGDPDTESVYSLQATERARLQRRLSELYLGFDAVIVDAGAGIEGVVRVSTLGASRLLVVTTPEPTALMDAYALLKVVTAQSAGLPIDILVNRTQDDSEGTVAFRRLASACSQFLQHSIGWLGALPEDAALQASVRSAEQLRGAISHTEAGRRLRGLLVAYPYVSQARSVS